MEQPELPERVARLEERSGHLATREDLVKNLNKLDKDLKDEILGVKNELQDLNIKVDKGFDELQSLVKTSVLANENKLLKRIIGWGLGIFTAAFSRPHFPAWQIGYIKFDSLSYVSSCDNKAEEMFHGFTLLL